MSRIRFEPTITWGTLITFITVIGSFLGVWVRIEKVIDNHETRIRYIERRVGLLGEYKEPQYEPPVYRKPGS